MLIGDMIASLTGKITYSEPGFIVIDVAGIGYGVFVTERLRRHLLQRRPASAGKNLTIYTVQEQLEQEQRLYGFGTPEEARFYRTLRSLPGIGGKKALQVLERGSPKEITRAVRAKDELFFTSVAGVGPKLAQKLIFELSRKIKDTAEDKTSLEFDPILKEAHEALLALGYRAREAYQALQGKRGGVEERVRSALQYFARGKK